MFGGNPNEPNNPFATREFWKSRLASGGHNPYGFGRERVAGALALQRNVAGLPTNTVPLPRHSNAGKATPTNFGGVQGALDAGKSWDQIGSLSRGRGHGFNERDYYQARQANSANSLTGGTGGSAAANAAYAANARVNQQPVAPRRRPSFGGY